MNRQCEPRCVLGVSAVQLLIFTFISVGRAGEITATEPLLQHLVPPSAIHPELRALHLWQCQAHSEV